MAAQVYVVSIALVFGLDWTIRQTIVLSTSLVFCPFYCTAWVKTITLVKLLLQRRRMMPSKILTVNFVEEHLQRGTKAFDIFFGDRNKVVWRKNRVTT